MRLRKALLLALVLALLPAASASAQADFTATLSGDSPKFTWESSNSGAPGAGPVRCSGNLWNCEHVLIDVQAAGELAITLESTEGIEGPSDPTGETPLAGGPLASAQDVDGYLYKSDATGAPEGDTLTDTGEEGTDCVSSFPSEACKVPVEPGFYVLEVEYFLAFEAPIVGTLELIGAAPSAPQPGGEQPPAQQPQQPPAQQPPAQQPQNQARQPASVRFTVSPSRDRRPPFAFRTSGEIVPPAGVNRQQACQGRVAIQVKRGKNTISTRRSEVGPDCKFSNAVKFNRSRIKKARSLRFFVRFQGNTVLLPTEPQIRSVRTR